MSTGLTALVRRRPVTSFLVLAFLVSWGWWLPIAFAGGIVRGGDPWPTHMPGLLGPLIAALVVTAVEGGRPALLGYVRRLRCWRGGWRTALLVISPVAALPLGMLVLGIVGDPIPPAQDYLMVSGLPSTLPLLLVGLLVLNGLGEEGGWRGFAQERLQQRLGPVRAALLITVVWALWHAPLFVILANFRGFSPATLPGFFLGMAAGAVVLAYVYNTAGGSVLAAAGWHVAYNLASASSGAQGTAAAVATTVVITQAVVLLAIAGRRARRHRESPLLGGRPAAAAGAMAVAPRRGSALPAPNR